jgi:dienelactone hydrolase
MRSVLGIIVVMTGLTAGAESESWVNGIVPDETGFEGAVTVATAVKEDGGFGVVTVNVPYRDVYGKPKMGQGRLVVRKEDIESGKPLPALCNVHYEKDVGGMKTWCRRGWACFTPHYGKEDEGEYALELPIGDSYNLAKAIIQWVRRLPFIDRTHLHLTGGSAGGYMTLAMSAECFPVSSASATAPVFNWAYTLGYFEANRTVSKYPQKDLKDSPLPILCMVTMLNDWSYGVFGKDLASDAYYHVSPVSYADRIANPVLIDCPTGDMLVPLEQISPAHTHAYDPAVFPEGYTRDFQACTHPEKARRTLADVVPTEELFVHVQPLAEGMHEFTLANFTNEEKDPPAPPTIDLPWSEDRQWSLVILDEGPPIPYSGHHRYKWATSPDSFTAHYQKAVPGPEILNAAKLERLMERYAGKLTAVAPLADGTPTNRLNFQELEKRDVVTGLLDYAGLGPAHEKRLKELYQECAVRPLINRDSHRLFGQQGGEMCEAWSGANKR